MVKIRKTIFKDQKLYIGRNEWCALPDLHIPAIKAKIDTGAKTSAIHAFNIKPVKKEGKKYVYFDMHPVQYNDEIIVRCKACVIDERYIMSSNGHKEHRFVIGTKLILGERSWDIEVTLSNRDPLRYRMLLGREALNNHVLINPSLTCNQVHKTNEDIIKLYVNKKRKGHL